MNTAYETATLIETFANDKKRSIYLILNDIGLSKNVVSRMKTTNKFPSVDRLQKICAFFDMSIDYLLGGEADYSPNPVVKMATPLEVANIIIALCNKNNITVNQMLRYCELEKTTITRMKISSQMISIEKLKKIADYFRISISYLIDAYMLENDELISYGTLECTAYVIENTEYILWKHSSFLWQSATLGQHICDLVNNFEQSNYDFMEANIHMESLRSALQCRASDKSIKKIISLLEHAVDELCKKYDFLFFVKKQVNDIVTYYKENNKLNKSYDYDYIAKVERDLANWAATFCKILYEFLNVDQPMNFPIPNKDYSSLLLTSPLMEYDFNLNTNLAILTDHDAYTEALVKICKADETIDIFKYFLLQCIEKGVKFKRCTKCAKWLVIQEKNNVCKYCGNKME